MTSDRPHLNWKVPTNEWDAFLEYVREKYGGTSGYARREVESAMREWSDEGDYSEGESQIRRLVEAANRTPEATSEKPEHTITWDSDRTLVGAQIGEFVDLIDQASDLIRHLAEDVAHHLDIFSDPAHLLFK